MRCSDSPSSNSNQLSSAMMSIPKGGAGSADDDRCEQRREMMSSDDDGHWSGQVRETVVSTGRDGLLHITVLGGADTGSFCWIGGDYQSVEMVKCHSGKLKGSEILLEVDGEQVAGYTLGDLLRLLWSATENGNPILLKTVDIGNLTVAFDVCSRVNIVK
jgi:hypothetical protein